MSRAWQLIDDPSKWADCPAGLDDGRHCAVTAIRWAYYPDRAAMRLAEEKLQNRIGHHQSIPQWNDSHQYGEVFYTMWELNI